MNVESDGVHRLRPNPASASTRFLLFFFSKWIPLAPRSRADGVWQLATPQAPATASGFPDLLRTCAAIRQNLPPEEDMKGRRYTYGELSVQKGPDVVHDGPAYPTELLGGLAVGNSFHTPAARPCVPTRSGRPTWCTAKNYDPSKRLPM